MPFSFTFAPSSRPAIGKLLLKSLRSLDQVRVGQRKMSVEGKVGAKESDPFSKKHVRSTKRTSPRMGRLNRSTLSALENKIQVYIPIALLYNRRKSLQKRELMKEKENKIEIFKR